MVTFLITALAVLVVIAIGLYLWQRPSQRTTENLLPPYPNSRGLFADDSASDGAHKELTAVATRELTESLVARADNGDLSALDEAHDSGNPGCYDRVLSVLANRSKSATDLLSLMSHVASRELPVNNALAQAVLEDWRVRPNRSMTAKALHFAALSDDAGVYRAAVQNALQLWRNNQLPDIPAVELRALFDGEFWVLSSGSRRSGAGFLLKRTLASARRELEATARPNQ